MGRIDTTRNRHASLGARASLAAVRATLRGRTWVVAATIALVALAALAIVAPTALMLVLIMGVVVGGVMMLTGRGEGWRDGAVSRPSYRTADRLTRRVPC